MINEVPNYALSTDFRYFRYFLSLRSKFLLQQPVFRHPQSMYFRQSQSPTFMYIERRD